MISLLPASALVCSWEFAVFVSFCIEHPLLPDHGVVKADKYKRNFINDIGN